MNTAVFSGLSKYRDLGLLVVRLALGAAFVIYGYPKMLGGPAGWEKLGGAVGVFGIKVYPMAWGFAAAFAEFAGGILLILGLFFRPAALLLLCTMIVAAATHLAAGDEIFKVLHPVELGAVFFALLFEGPGKFSVDGR